MPRSIVPYKDLLSPPIGRAAYSDRTAWLMAEMSRLAYIRFEDSTPVEVAATEVLKLITGEDDPDKWEKSKKLNKNFRKEALSAILRNVASCEDREENRKNLEARLKDLRFTLIKTLSVHIPLIADTQAFIVKLEEEGRDPFLVLVFRGTEPTKPADLKSDLHASPQVLGRLGGPGATQFIPVGAKDMTFAQKTWPAVKVHPGFWKAFKVAEDEIKGTLNKPEFQDLPLYITGHSLGGALAVVATYALNSDRVAACYTFGGPRVGNLQFGLRVKPPVYRVINAIDIVPRLPPGVLVDVFTMLLRAIPMIPLCDKFADFLERFRGYRHYGDLRYLDASEPEVGEDNIPQYPNMLVRSNPPQISRWYWYFSRLITAGVQAAATDHKIDGYVEKLAYWAHIRSKR